MNWTTPSAFYTCQQSLVRYKGGTTCLDRLGKGVLNKVAQEETCLVDTSLGPELGVSLFRVHNSPGLGVKVVDVCVLSLRPLCCIRERRDDEPLKSRDLGSLIDDVLKLLRLMLTSPLIESLSRLGFFLIGRVSVQTPKVTDGKDGVGVFKRSRESRRLVNVGLDDLGTARCEGLGFGA